MTTVRRTYLYAISMVTLVVWTWGIGLLLQLLLQIAINSTSSYISVSPGFFGEQLSLGLAMIAISFPIWLIIWRTVHKHARHDPSEKTAALRKLYLNLILGASSITALTTGIGVTQWLLSGAEIMSLPAGALAALPVCLGVWYFHWRLESSDGQPCSRGRTLQRWYIYFVSAWALFTFARGFALTFSDALYSSSLWSGTILGQGQFWDSHMTTAVASLFLGAIWWGFHWLYVARNDAGSTLRQVYLYIFTIFGGAVTALVAITTTLYRLLGFLLGSQGLSWEPYFLFFSWTIPTMIIGIAAWIYHWHIVKREAPITELPRSTTRRVYYYLLSGVGLGTVVSGLAIFIGLLIDLLLNVLGTTQILIYTSGWWRNPLALFIVMIIVGVPIWIYHWISVQRNIGKVGIIEQSSRSRRIYLYTVLCLSIIAFLTSLIYIIFRLLSGALQNTLDPGVFNDIKWSLQAFIVACPLLIYHWNILRGDQRAGSERSAQRKSFVAIVDQENSTNLIPRLEKAIDLPIQMLNPFITIEIRNSPPSNEEVTKLANEILEAKQEKILIIAFGTEVSIFPYDSNT
ncbi:DUF5671 domain-containing protein [Chloroflexota bacterium]